MNLTIPDELLTQHQLSSQKIKQDIALFLLEKCHFTLEQATQIAEMPLVDFKKLLNKRNKKFNKLNNLKTRNCVIGNSDDLIHNDWSNEWKTPLI